MALSISNTYTNKTSTPMTAGGGYKRPNIFTKWGIGRNSSMGGGSVFPQAPKPAAPAPKTTWSVVPPTTTGFMAAPKPAPTATTPNPNALTSTPQAYAPTPATQTVSPVKGMVAPPTKTPKQDKGLFQKTVEGLTDASKPSSKQRAYLQQLEIEASRAREIANDARNISQKYGSEIGRIGELGAGAVAGNLSTGSNVVGSGNAAIASQSASARIQALQNSLSAELQGNQQQLAGQEQALTAANYGLSGANTQQQLAQQALSSAATYAQPSPAGFGQTVFDPLTGTYGGGSEGLNPQAVASQLADAVRSGKMTYEQAVSSLGYAGGAGQQFLNSALGGGFNIPQSQATLQGQTGVIGQLPQLEAADIAAEGVKNKIVTYLSQNPNLNPSAIAKANVIQQWIEGKQLSDPKYQTLFNLINEYTNTLAPILGVGGDPTNLKTEIAQSFINAAASGQSIAEVLENMQSLSRGKLQDIKSGALGGGVVSSPFSGGGTGSGGMYDW